MSCLQATQRPQALPSIGVATQMDSCGLRMFSRSPPHPPSRVNPRSLKPCRAGKGGGDRQKLWRGSESMRKIRGFAYKTRCNPHGSKQKCLTDFSKNPRKHSFLPRICKIFHGFSFVVFWLTLSLSFSFTNEKERERGVKTSKTGKKPNPRIFELLKFPSPENSGGEGHFRGFGGFFKPSFLYKSTAYAAIHANPRIFTKNALPPADSSQQTLGFTLEYESLVHCAFEVYNGSVTSKKGVIGFGIPMHHCDTSRSSPADRAASLSVPPVLAARMGGRKACRFTQVMPGIPTHSSCRPRLESSAMVFVNRITWRPHMANTQTRPATPGATSAFSPDFVELVTGIRHDAEQARRALAGITELLHGCDANHQLSAGGLQSLLEPIWASLDTLCGDLRAMHVGEVVL